MPAQPAPFWGFPFGWWGGGAHHAAAAGPYGQHGHPDHPGRHGHDHHHGHDPYGHGHHAFHGGRGRHARRGGHGHGFDRGLGAGPDVGRFGERLHGRLSAFLDLSASQDERLTQLIDQLRAQRSAFRAVARGAAFARLIEGDNLDRDAAQRLYDTQIDALRAAGPALIESFAAFFDALDFDQQQALRFAMRRMRHRGGRDGHDHRDHRDGGDPGAAPAQA